MCYFSILSSNKGKDHSGFAYSYGFACSFSTLAWSIGESKNWVGLWMSKPNEWLALELPDYATDPLHVAS